MIARLLFAVVVCAVALHGQDVKAKTYVNPEECFKTYRLATGRVLTSKGLIEDPTVNAIMKDVVATQMSKLKIAEANTGAELEVRFMGGTGAGIQEDAAVNVGDIMMWDLSGGQSVPGRTYKKSTLVFGIVETRTNRTLWAARCTDKFGDPAKMRERIEKAVAKAFTKFPKKAVCN